jgi:WD40 repeat protein
MAFSPDGRILAIRKSSQVVQLLDPEQAQELASVPAERAVPLCFSPDSTLFVVGEHGTTVRVWDLRLVREQLAKLNLDWELPPYPQKTSIASGPIRIHVEEGSGKPGKTE